MSCVVILAVLPRCYTVFFVSDELSVLSNMKWVLIGISCPSLLFLSSISTRLCPVSDVANATPPSGSGLFMFFISFTSACVSVSVPVTFGGVRSH